MSALNARQRAGGGEANSLGFVRRPLARALCAFAAVLSTASGAATISNTASMSFRANGGAVQTISSNEVQATTAKGPPAVVRFTRIAANYANKLPIAMCRNGTNDLTDFDGDGLAEEPPAGAYSDTHSYASTAPILIELTNPAGNRDPNVREFEEVTLTSAFGDVEHLRLEETGEDTGIYAGALPSAIASIVQDDCHLQIRRRDRIHVSFDGDEDGTNNSDDDALIDPFGFVFDSVTGQVVNGARITVINDATGLPAQVFGDDGVSAYPNTMLSGETVSDASGALYPGSPGRYRFPLLAAGRYHLKIEPPEGYAAPSVATPAQLATLEGPAGSYIIDGPSYGQAFLLSDPEPLQVDIPLDPGNAALTLDKVASTRTASPGDVIQYRLRLVNRDANLSAVGVTISDVLPAGLRYRRGSTRGIAEPDVSGDGRSLTFRAPMMRPGSAAEIRYTVEVTPGAPVGEALNRAIAMNANGERSAEGRASVRIRPLLNTDAITIIGRVTQGPCEIPFEQRKGVANARILMEDGTYVVTDKDGLYHFEGVRAGRHVVQLDVGGLPASLTPIDCEKDTRTAGSAISRFVEGQGGTLQRIDFVLNRDPAKEKAEEAVIPQAADDASAAGNGIDWLDGIEPGVDFLFPTTDHNPRAPVLRVVIKHLPGQKVALRVNGAPVDELLRDQGDGNGQIVIAKWSGLPLKDGDNQVEARVTDASGREVAVLRRTVHYANVAAHAEYLPARSKLIADGVTKPVIAVRLTDREGKPVRAGTPAAFTIDAPYRAAMETAAQEARPLQGLGNSSPAARVTGDEGIAYIPLDPTAQAGAARMVFSFPTDGRARTEEVRPWLQAAARDWVVVGFGAGTFGHQVLSGQAKKAGGLKKNDTITDGQVALYAKGRIKGSWLATIAYDSDRKVDRDRGLMGVIDPDRYYTVYGDGSQQGYDAATRGKLYLRLERQQFYALFGDFRTDLTEGQLTKFNRTLNGFKSEFRAKSVSIAAFAANSDDLHGRDEIQGNGLTGPYRLRAREIVPNSDLVRLETRDRFRSELVIETRQLSRHIDYDVDATNGTLTFKAPVPTRDLDGNPVFIVADYELYGTGTKRLVAGGRAAATLLNGRVEVGANLIRDETLGNATLGGVDLKAKITRTTTLRAEAATGGPDGLKQNRAYIAEVEHHDGRTDLLAYVRQQDARFGLGQQNVVEAGTRKYGADGRIRIWKGLSASTSVWHQESLTGPATRDAIDARLEWKGDDMTLHAGVKIADDKGNANVERDSRLIAVGGTRDFFKHKLTVAAENQFALGGKKDSLDFPVRRSVTAAWTISDSVRLIGGTEFAEGARYSARNIRAGFELSPWAGAKISTTGNREVVGENGPRSFAQFGLAQSLPIGEHWTVDAGFDSSRTIKGKIAEGDIVNPLQPVSTIGSIGQDGRLNEDYDSISLGAGFQYGQWSWNGRIEGRKGESADRWGISSNVMRRLGEGRTIASSLRAYRIKNQNGSVAALMSGDVAVAWRPLDSRWAVLERLEVRHERGDAGVGAGNVLGVGTANGQDALSTRIVNNLAVNWRSGLEAWPSKWEATLYSGVKYVRGKFDDDKFDGLIDVTGFDLRRDIGHRVDVGLSVNVQHSWTQKTLAYSFGPSVGVSPADNLWISVGYNAKGFRDRDFEDNRYLKQGPYVTLRLKFDQQSIATMGGKAKGGGR
ncbi:hypothetical protein [Sphingomonas crocodyli]|nr:hypothetical protein [Sphingomonas crocodyli]